MRPCFVTNQQTVSPGINVIGLEIVGGIPFCSTRTKTNHKSNDRRNISVTEILPTSWFSNQVPYKLTATLRVLTII